MARPGHTYRGNTPGKTVGRGKIRRQEIRERRQQEALAGITSPAAESVQEQSNSTPIVPQNIDPSIDPSDYDTSLPADTVWVPLTEETTETPAERKNRLARERRAAKKAAEQSAE